MSMHQKDFDPMGKFDVCSEYFAKDCFPLAFPMKGIKRYLKRGICVLGVFCKGLFSACFSNERHKKVFEEGDSSNHLEKIL